MTQRQAKKLLRGVPFIRGTDDPRLACALGKQYRAFHRYLQGGRHRRFKWGARR